MNILALSGSPRKGANSDSLTDLALEGARSAGAKTEKILLRDLHIKPCRGCLRCNLLGYCSIKKDDFDYFKDKFLESRAVILSAPVYYHYIPGEMKVLMDRFRSTLHVQITEEKLNYTYADTKKGKSFFFILTLGHPKRDDAIPALQALKLWAGMTSREPVILNPLIATFLALPDQINASREKLSSIFQKMSIPLEILEEKYDLYQNFKEYAYEAGKKLVNI